MVELTVGYASGLIALGVLLVQLFVPAALVFILAGFLRDTNTAVTWSVAGRTLQSSYWPLLLGVESTASHGVRNDVEVLAYLIPSALGLIAIAGIVTPLGLHDALVSGDETVARFEYVKDTSPMGFGTPPRSTLGFSRRCGGFTPVACPGSNNIVVTSRNESVINAEVPFGYDVSIPQTVIDLYSSGSRDSRSVSNVFDIHWRQYATSREDDINNGSTFLVGAFRQLQSMVLNDAIEPVEGLVVNTVDGGIGFRNHTLPVGLGNGASWTEDMLFMEPETQCVDTNMTLNFRYRDSTPDITSRSAIKDLVLTDAGGFVNLIKEYPYYNRDDIQANPDLSGRAYKAAWMWNSYMMLYFNVTNPAPDAFSYLNSSIGRTFPLDPDLRLSTDALTISSSWDGLLNFYGLNLTNAEKYTTPGNPHGVDYSFFRDIGTICAGAAGTDIGNISNVAVGCGLVYGAPRREDDSESLIFDAGSRWKAPIYACATAVKATIKSVDFQVNGTQNFRAFSVSNVREKAYVNDDAKPLWGVEDAGLELVDGQPLWGLVAPSFEGREGLSTVRKESLYLPGLGNPSSSFAGDPFSTVQNLPAVNFPSKAIGVAYNVGRDSAITKLIDYSGRSSMAMYAKWQALSRTPETTAKILNLIWTDVSASAVTGTKGASASPSNDLSSLPVRPVVRRINYHYPYAIPAFIVALLCLVVAVWTILSYACGGANFETLRRHLYQTCAGRLMTTLMVPEESDLRMSCKQWVRGPGTKKIDLSGTHPAAGWDRPSNKDEGDECREGEPEQVRVQVDAGKDSGRVSH